MKIKSHLWVSMVFVLLIISCNTYPDKNPGRNPAHSNQMATLSDIRFGRTIDKTLEIWGMSLKDNDNKASGPKIDFEEFTLKKDVPAELYSIDLSHKFRKISVFYDKKSKVIFRYELRISGKDLVEEMIKVFKEKYGSPLFYRDQEGKSGSVFIDQEGNQVVDSERSYYQWNDRKTRTSFFMIRKTEGQSEVLEIIAMERNSKRNQQESASGSTETGFPE
ncbi:hypothetical protein [Sphingobacterium spiritivorum]|uniref:hypothetical protein n=1 Tax=Sphingobacterium spiritivorum TaxID=258 RepID=UPI001919B1B2|nr:hypothetical protein [Sphingobacterium spiritivorum]QQT25913.1 hypothetical protein I6J02_19765 [Sphingobacterium spiritivorum]